MARKSIVFTVEADNRDKGKQFKITEMPHEKGRRVGDPPGVRRDWRKRYRSRQYDDGHRCCCSATQPRITQKLASCMKA